MDIIKNMSDRLITVSDMLGSISDDKGGTLYKYKCVADVGCDHGYVSIYLVDKNIAESAIAMDVRKGPLSMAENNIKSASFIERIQVRLSDGITELDANEADALVIAGMGGKLMISILEKKDLRELGIKTAILQPQSDIDEFRQYLRDKGYEIEDEKVVFEDGKYYFPMRVNTGEFIAKQDAVEKVLALLPRTSYENALRICNRYGEHNILRRDALLKDYLTHGLEVNSSILQTINKSQHQERFQELVQEKSDIELLLKLFS